MSGFFVALEGTDGAGKSTQAALLAEAARASGKTALLVREPGGTPLGERIREILLGKNGLAIRAEAELLLFLASRVQLYEDRIAPALARGETVISDRYHLSTIVYQGIGRGLGEAHVAKVCAEVLGERVPRLNIVLEIPLAKAQERMRREPDRMEDPQLLARVVDGFARTRGLPGDRITRVSGEGTPAEVSLRIQKAVADAL